MQPCSISAGIQQQFGNDLLKRNKVDNVKVKQKKKNLYISVAITFVCGVLVGCCIHCRSQVRKLQMSFLPFVGSFFGPGGSKEERSTSAKKPQPQPQQRRSSSPPAEDIPPELHLKLLVVGGPNVGKTSIVRRYCYDLFTKHSDPTIGMDLTVKVLRQEKYPGLPSQVHLQFWDISHAEVNGQLHNNFFKDVAGILMVFDCTKSDAQSRNLTAVDQWLGVTVKALGQRRTFELPMALLANQVDKGRSLIKDDHLSSYCRRCGYTLWYYTSARSGQGVKEAIDGLVGEILHQRNAQKQLQEQKRTKRAGRHYNIKKSKIMATTNAKHRAYHNKMMPLHNTSSLPSSVRHSSSSSSSASLLAYRRHQMMSRPHSASTPELPTTSFSPVSSSSSSAVSSAASSPSSVSSSFDVTPPILAITNSEYSADENKENGKMEARLSTENEVSSPLHPTGFRNPVSKIQIMAEEFYNKLEKDLKELSRHHLLLQRDNLRVDMHSLCQQCMNEYSDLCNHLMLIATALCVPRKAKKASIALEQIKVVLSKNMAKWERLLENISEMAVIDSFTMQNNTDKAKRGGEEKRTEEGDDGDKRLEPKIRRNRRRRRKRTQSSPFPNTVLEKEIMQLVQQRKNERRRRHRRKKEASRNFTSSSSYIFEATDSDEADTEYDEKESYEEEEEKEETDVEEETNVNKTEQRKIRLRSHSHLSSNSQPLQLSSSFLLSSIPFIDDLDEDKQQQILSDREDKKSKNEKIASTENEVGDRKQRNASSDKERSLVEAKKGEESNGEDTVLSSPTSSTTSAYAFYDLHNHTDKIGRRLSDNVVNKKNSTNVKTASASTTTSRRRTRMGFGFRNAAKATALPTSEFLNSFLSPPSHNHHNHSNSGHESGGFTSSFSSFSSISSSSAASKNGSDNEEEDDDFTLPTTFHHSLPSSSSFSSNAKTKVEDEFHSSPSTSSSSSLTPTNGDRNTSAPPSPGRDFPSPIFFTTSSSSSSLSSSQTNITNNT